MKQKNKIVLFSVLAVFALIAVLAVPSALADVPPSKTYPANAVWFDPEDSSVAEYCDTVDVDVWITTSEPTISFVGVIDYTFCCANVTDFRCNETNWDLYCEADLTPGHVVIGAATWRTNGNPAGLTHIGTLTIHCCNETSDCLTDLTWDTEKSYIENPDYEEITPVSWHDGTFTCGERFEPCLGDCYADPACTGDPTTTNVPCYGCLGPNGAGGWKPTTRCPGRDLWCPDMCFNECPACCDGNDNDNDGLVDCPDDPECACCCDYTETPEDPAPCVPELPTIALTGIGMLSLVLLAHGRRQKRE
jgi:hypothetical protein